MYFKKFAALLFALAILLGSLSFSANAVSIASVIGTLETKAINYIESFAKVSYLYETHDLTSGTLFDLYGLSGRISTQELERIPSAERIALCGTERNVHDLCENLAVFAMTANFFKQAKTEQKIVRTNFTMCTNITGSYVEEDSAVVQLYTHITFNYAGDSQVAEMGDNYTVYFKRISNTWYIADVFSEEIEFCGYGDILSTFDERLSCVRAQEEAVEIKSLQTSASQDERTSTVAEIIESDLGNYNATRATAYAYTYTTSTYTGNGNNSSFMNPIYPNYTNDGGNCANFVSQCLFAGLGGNDEAASVIGGNFPMHYASNGWYYSTNGRTLPWCCADDLKYYTFGENGYSNTRIRGTKAVLEKNSTSFSDADIQSGSISSSISVSTLPGAILTYRGSISWHTSIITDATGLAYSQVKICENSPMRKAVTLQDRLYSSYKVYYFKPHYMIEDTTCGSSTTHNMIIGCCRCRNANCDYTSLCVWGNVSRPIPVNTTLSLLGTANTTCYRMMIKITAPNGTITRQEATNASVVSKSYNFSQVGLYTIEIFGQDLPESNTWSSTDTHVYKIRVY